jgi:hypothetical protein
LLFQVEGFRFQVVTAEVRGGVGVASAFFVVFWFIGKEEKSLRSCFLFFSGWAGVAAFVWGWDFACLFWRYLVFVEEVGVNWIF